VQKHHLPHSDPSLIQQFELIAEEYSRGHHLEIFNLSHWNAGREYHRKVESALQLLPEGSRFDYEFSQTLPQELTTAVASKLGLSSNRVAQITPSGTLANLLALVLLKTKGRRRLIVVGPCYFQVPILAKELGLEVVHTTDWLPGEAISTKLLDTASTDLDAFWLTNPVYCFGHLYTREQIEDMSALLEGGYALIADECNASIGTELGHALNGFANFIGTYSPHKSVCINGLKFGVLNVPQSEINTIRLLGDSWVGPLPRSIRTDMSQFISENFSSVERLFLQQLKKNEQLFQSLISRLPVQSYAGSGHFRVLTLNGVTRVHETSIKLFQQVVEDTQSAFIPMVCNAGPSSLEFSFRVNLLTDMPKLAARLPLIVEAINQRCRP